MWKDIDISFQKQKDGDIATNYGVDAIKNSLTNIFGTLQGQRRMIIDFAAPIFNLLFEPVDEITAENIASLLLLSIEIWETRIELRGLNIIAIPDANMYRCTLTFVIKEDSQEIHRFDYILRRN